MNCKPNQLARIIATEETIKFKMEGIIITTVKQVVSETCLPAWTYEGNRIIVKCPCGCGTRAEITSLADEILRPILNPGDDVEDNATEFQPPVPIKTLEPA